jgi:hypothetical protein
MFFSAIMNPNFVKHRKALYTIICCLQLTVLSAQDRETVTQTITWTSFNSNLQVSRKFTVVTDAQFRFIHDFENMQHMVRAGISYEVTPHLSIVPIGYSFIYNYKYGKQPAGFVNHEQRLWQQAFYKHTIKNVPMNHRLRLEERWLQDHNASNESNAYSDYQWRMRYRILANIPLSKKTLEPKTLYLSVWDEFFWSWGGSVTFHEINQNRIFIGPGFQLTKNTQIQAGFYSQLLIKANGAKQENNNGLLIQINANADLRKKE